MNDATRVERDERYPFYVIDCDWSGAEEVTVPPDTLARWRRVMAEFEQVQNEIEAAWMAQTTKGQRQAAWEAEHTARLTKLRSPRHANPNH